FKPTLGRVRPITPAYVGSCRIIRRSNAILPTLGPPADISYRNAMSALPPKADIVSVRRMSSTNDDACFLRGDLCAPGTPEGLCCLCGGYESGVSILRRHRRGGLDIRQATSRGSGEYCSGGGPVIGELADNQPVVAAEGQVPLDELASDTLEEFGNGFLAILRLTHHAFDGI